MKHIVFKYNLHSGVHSFEAKDKHFELKWYYDSKGRLKEYTFYANNSRVLVLSVQSFQQDRIQEFFINTERKRNRKIRLGFTAEGRFSSASESVPHDVWNTVETVLYRKDGGVAHRTQRNEVFTYQHDTRGLPVRIGSSSYVYDLDGYLVQRKQGNLVENFYYDSMGRLSKAVSRQYRRSFHYDAHGRLVARRDLLASPEDSRPKDDMQLLYADPEYPRRVSHSYHAHSDRFNAYYYTPRDGRLFAMESAGQFYYIATDYFGSPFIVFDMFGNIKHYVDYSMVGVVLQRDSSLDFPFGYHGGIDDHASRLILFDGRAYDPFSAQWATPDLQAAGLFRRLTRLQLQPELINAYLFDHSGGGDFQDMPRYNPSVAASAEFWLRQFNIDPSYLLPRVSVRGEVTGASLLDLPVVRSPFDRLQVRSVHRCALADTLHRFQRISLPSAHSSCNNEELFAGLDRMPSFATVGSLFGTNMTVSTDPDGTVRVDQTGAMDLRPLEVVATLLNKTRVLPYSYSINDRIVHYIVNPSLEDAKYHLPALHLKADGSVIRMPSIGANVSATRTDHTLDVRIRHRHTLLYLRYGASIGSEKNRIVARARTRAARVALARDRQEFRHGREAFSNDWLPSQQQQLRLSPGRSRVAGYTARARWSLARFPELADDPNNVRWVPSQRRRL